MKPSGPLTVDEIMAAITAITPITTKNPKQTVRGAISRTPFHDIIALLITIDQKR